MILENLNATTSMPQYREVTEPEIDPPQTENSSDDSPEVSDEKGSRGHDTRQGAHGETLHKDTSDGEGAGKESEVRTHRGPLPRWKGRHVDLEA